MGLALFEIILNWNEYYVGARAYNQALYQFLAKVHELMIQASLAGGLPKLLFPYFSSSLLAQTCLLSDSEDLLLW